MPDPDSTATAKLYSIEFYALARQVLTDAGRMVVQAGSPYFAPRTYWCVEASIRDAGLVSVPYYMSVPSFGDWGFHLASAKQPELRLPANVPPLRSLDADSLRAAGVFPVDRRRVDDIEPSTLMRPLVLDYAKQEWRDY
ncbi:spermine/spermidine synthase domain-containing protein [Kibdelosporangium aridum]|uniref:Spermine/spermidine synthase n=2 Tax=Kibdelosporangium aridum TaxID=2030 RepID=A0A1Y5XVK3_KIBAR|nr:hypothetical protein [Kibdelosporangium aridum]SMD19248.1 Spermine/spermidine synthase [Kibdelosporangium aridum]